METMWYCQSPMTGRSFKSIEGENSIFRTIRLLFADRLAARYANGLALSGRKRHSRRLPSAFGAPPVCWRAAGEHVSNAPSLPVPLATRNISFFSEWSGFLATESTGFWHRAEVD